MVVGEIIGTTTHHGLDKVVVRKIIGTTTHHDLDELLIVSFLVVSPYIMAPYYF